MALPVLQNYLEGAKRKGYFEQAREMVYDFYYNRKFSKYPFQFHTATAYDEQTLKGSETLNSKNKDNFRNQPTPYYEIFKAFQFVHKEQQSVNFLDLGCGNGRVLVAGMSLGFNKVTGIDIDPEAIASAIKNCSLAKDIFPKTQFEVLYHDAATYVIPTDINVIFLCNPFGQDTLKIVVENISKSYKADPREMYLLYFNPLFPETLQTIEGLVKIYEQRLKSGQPHLFIYQLKKG